MKGRPTNAPRDRRNGNAARQGRAARLPVRRRLLFAGFATLGFFALLELTLWVFRVEPAARQSDPAAGFSGQSRLFTECESASGQPLLVTAENRLPWFNRQSFPREKPPGTFRIFCLGGSTTYGHPYDDRTSFAGFLRAFLPEMDPSHAWEVINAGGISYASYRIERLVRELNEYEPDLFVIYTGHNEFLEDRTYSSAIDTPEWVQRTVGLARWSRTFSLMQRVLRGSRASQHLQSLSDDVDAILDRSVGPGAYHRDDPWHEQVVAHFRDSLERIVDTASDAGAQIVLVIPASNLRDCAPFKSQHRDGLPADRLREFLAHLRAAEEALHGGKPAGALSRLEQALDIDPRHAGANFLRGRALLETGDAAAAREAFVRAREEDVCPLRAVTAIEQIVANVAKTRRVPVVDFSSIVSQRAEYGIPGADWFLDHVHPTVEGYQLLARELADQLVAMHVVHPLPSWTPDGFDRIARRVEEQIDHHDHATALRNLAKVLSWAGRVEDADRLALKAAELLPNDEEAKTMVGYAKLRLNQANEAKACFEAALRIRRDNVRALCGLGDVHARLGQYEAARNCFLQAIAADPKHAPAHYNLGNAFRSLGQLKKAEAAYRQAISLAPGQPDSHKNLGLVLFAQGDLGGTVREFETALALEDHVAQRHVDLGFVLIDWGERQRAETEFRLALAIDPACVSATFGLALLYEQAGDLSRARRLIRDALRIAPNDVNLHYILAQHALQRGDGQTAKAELETVLRLDASHADARRLRAAIP